MTLGDTDIARRTLGQLVLRPNPVRVSWRLADLTSSDGNAIEATFHCAVRALDEASERRMLEETFFAQGNVLNLPVLAAYATPRLQAVAGPYVASQDVESILSDAGKSSLQLKLTEACKSLAFASGLKVSAPFDLDLDSPTLRQKTRAQRQVREQSERLTAATDLFKQFQAIRQNAPELSASQVLSRIGSADQAQLLRALLLSAAKESSQQVLWLVAGNSLFRVDHTGLDAGKAPSTCLIELPATLGPLRSVQRGDSETTLLLGARAGVWRVDPTAVASATPFTDPATNSALGFSAAAVHGARLWASHGEAGIVAWEIDTPGKPVIALRPGQVSITNFAPRFVTALDADRLACASGSALVIVEQDGSLRAADGGPGSAVIALMVDAGQVITVHDDGQVCARDVRTLSLQSQARRTGKLTAAGTLPWLDSRRLLLASEEGPIFCLGVEDELVTQYTSTHRGLRIASASPECIVAVSADRQRLVFWNSWDGRQPACEIHLGALARHRIADMKFV